MNNRAVAEDIVRHARARHIIRGWLTLDTADQRLFVNDISGFVKLGGRTGALAQAALQTYYDEKAKSLPWNKWLYPDEKIDGYTGRPEHDDYYIEVEPDSYYRDTYLRLQSPDGEIITVDTAYEDGEAVIDLPEEYLAYQVVEACSDIWGYKWLRSIWEWAQEPVGPYEKPVTERHYRRGSEGLELIAEKTYSPDDANQLYLDLPAPDGPDEEVCEEDRGYEPPTFTPTVDLNTADVQAFIREYDTEIDHLAQAMFDQLVADQMAYSEIRDIGTPPELDVPDDLPALLTGSYLTEGERYRVLQHLASRIRGLIPDHVLARLSRLDRNNDKEELYAILNQCGPALKYWDNVNSMTDACGLTEFVDLWFDELHDSDTRGHKQITTDLEIEQMAEQILQDYVDAPIIKLPVKELEAKWAQNPKQFPAQEKVRTARKNGCVYFWLADSVDYKTLNVLYKLAGLDIPGPQLHAHLPFVQKRVIDLIMSGADISGAYKLAREEANRIRQQQRQPKGQVQIIGYENQRFLVETGRNPAKLHPGALDHVVIVPTDELRQILTQALNNERSIEGPIHRAYRRLFGGRHA